MTTYVRDRVTYLTVNAFHFSVAPVKSIFSKHLLHLLVLDCSEILFLCSAEWEGRGGDI